MALSEYAKDPIPESPSTCDYKRVITEVNRPARAIRAGAFSMGPKFFLFSGKILVALGAAAAQGCEFHAMMKGLWYGHPSPRRPYALD